MINDKVFKRIGFLEAMDNFIKDNYNKLICDHLFQIYCNFCKDLREMASSAFGFVRLSEFLLFRFLYYALGGDFERKDVPQQQEGAVFIAHDKLSYFEKKVNENESLLLGRSLKLARCANIAPDISIVLNNTLIGVIEIKTYLTSGMDDIERVRKRIERISNIYKNPQVLLIIFSRISEKGKVHKELEKFKNYLILQGNDTLFIPAIRETMPCLEKFLESPNNVMRKSAMGNAIEPFRSQK